MNNAAKENSGKKYSNNLYILAKCQFGEYLAQQFRPSSGRGMHIYKRTHLTLWIISHFLSLQIHMPKINLPQIIYFIMSHEIFFALQKYNAVITHASVISKMLMLVVLFVFLFVFKNAFLKLGSLIIRRNTSAQTLLSELRDTVLVDFNFSKDHFFLTTLTRVKLVKLENNNS